MELQSAISRRRKGRPTRANRYTRTPTRGEYWTDVAADAYVTLKMIFSGDRQQNRLGLKANPWALPIIELVQGRRTLRGNYLGSSWLPPKGSLRARTREIYHSSIYEPRPTILFAPDVEVPGAVDVTYGLGLKNLNPEGFILRMRVWFRRTQKNAVLRRAAAARHQRGVFRRDFDPNVSLRLRAEMLAQRDRDLLNHQRLWGNRFGTS